MANDCLRKSLKGTIVKDLPFLGYVFVKVPVSGSNSFYVYLDREEEAIALNGTWVQTGTNKRTGISHIVAPNVLIVSSQSDEYCEALIPKYHINRFVINGKGSCNIDDFKASECPFIGMEVSSATAGDVPIKGTAEGFAEKLGGNVTLKRAATFEIPFDCTNIGKNGLITTFNIIQASNVKGSLVNLAYCNNLTTFYGNAGNSFVCEDYVAIKRTIGTTTGSVSIPYLGVMNATFNGQPIANQLENTLSWTATTITLNGTTIDA